MRFRVAIRIVREGIVVAPREAPVVSSTPVAILGTKQTRGETPAATTTRLGILVSDARRQASSATRARLRILRADARVPETPAATPFAEPPPGRPVRILFRIGIDIRVRRDAPDDGRQAPAATRARLRVRLAEHARVTPAASLARFRVLDAVDEVERGGETSARTSRGDWIFVAVAPGEATLATASAARPVGMFGPVRGVATDEAPVDVARGSGGAAALGDDSRAHRVRRVVIVVAVVIVVVDSAEGARGGRDAPHASREGVRGVGLVGPVEGTGGGLGGGSAVARAASRREARTPRSLALAQGGERRDVHGGFALRASGLAEHPERGELRADVRGAVRVGGARAEVPLEEERVHGDHLGRVLGKRGDARALVRGLAVAHRHRHGVGTDAAGVHRADPCGLAADARGAR